MPRLLLALVFVAAGCDSDGDDAPAGFADAAGLAAAESGFGVGATADRIMDLLDGNDAVSVIARVDHAQNAMGAGLSLPPTEVILFGNPALGTPLMQAEQGAGIDLPQKMLVYEHGDGDVIVAYNTTEYLVRRHDVGGVPTLDQIATALETFAEGGSDGTVTENPATTIDSGEGLIAVESDADAATTFGRLRSAVEANPDLSIIAELDHAANAAGVGMDLRPTRLLVFGNPALGTPLMQAERSVAVDLPQKALVYTDAEGRTFVVYNRPSYLAERHGIEGQDDVLGQIATALSGLAATAAGADG